MSDRESSPRWRRRKEARPAEIVAAAYEVFAEKGFAGAKLDDIAARAGVSKGAIYLYFETKQDVFEAVVHEAISPNVDAAAAFVAHFPGPFEDLVRLLFERIAEIAAQSPIGKVAKIVIGESGNFPALARIWHDQMIARGLGLMTWIVEDAQKRGELRAGDPRAYALSMVAPVLVAVLFRETFAPIGAQAFDIPALARHHAETVLSGLLIEYVKDRQA